VLIFVLARMADLARQVEAMWAKPGPLLDFAMADFGALVRVLPMRFPEAGKRKADTNDINDLAVYTYCLYHSRLVLIQL
jgi:hypothetical protein